MPALSLALKLDDKESEKESEKASEWERENVLYGWVCACLCVFCTVPLLFVLFAYLFFYEPVGSLSFCFVSHPLCSDTKHVCFLRNTTLYSPHKHCILYNLVKKKKKKMHPSKRRECKTSELRCRLCPNVVSHMMNLTWIEAHYHPVYQRKHKTLLQFYI